MADEFKTPDLYRKELTRMENAMRAQVEWLKNWHVLVFAGSEDEDLTLDDLRHSPFRTWYKGISSELFDDSPVFVALGFSLESMQALANQLVLTIQEEGALPPEEYRAFMDSVVNFNDLVFKLMREALNKVAHVDNLTGVGNETGMRAQISAERERIRRTEQVASVALVELGGYRSIDDKTTGSHAGVEVSRSEVIATFADALVDMLRPYDQIYRIDNDNFMMCLPYTDTDVAHLVVTRIQTNLQEKGLILEDGTHVLPSVLFGIAPILGNDEIEDVLTHAREALNLAGQSEQTSVVTWSPPTVAAG